MKKFRKRLRFIGFTHFLRHSKMKSWRGKRASLRARVARSRLLEMKVRNSRYSWRRGYVPQSIVRLADLNESLENGNAESAIKLAKMLMRARREGARLPDGSQLVRLTRMDQAHYAMEQKGVVQSFASSPPSSKRPFLQPPDLQRFATMDYNTMLLRCQDLEDWENGYKVSLILLKRYRSPAFSFSDMSAPNTATICLMSNHFLQNRASEKAKRLSDILRDRYSKAIPLDMYVHIMNRAAHLPGQLPFMEFVSSYLRDHGPTPTTTLYNTLLRAHGFASGVEGAEAYLQKMLSLGCSADQQSFQILIDVSLKNLDLARAHRWLAECERQGFHATPRMMEPFMKACTQEVICNSVVKHNVGSPQIERVNGYVQEWMYKSLQVLQFMSSQRIMPTATTFEMLIEALLSQRNYREARKLLNRMRGSPHMYTPASKTWILFFEYHLATNNYVSAFNILKEMNRVVQPWRSTYMVNESVVNNPKTHPALVASLTANSSVVPVRLYRQLFRHLLGHSKVSLAERTLYEMMIAKRRRRPKEKEVADLIWSLDRYPEAAERVYELLYSQTWDTPAQYDPVTMILVNRITEEGPIQLGNVGVMRAKANSDNVALRDEVWWRWKSMIQVISSREDAFQMQQLKEGVSTPSHEVLTKKEKTVLAAAFEQVARASRQETAVIMEPELSAEAKALQTQGTDVASWSSSTSVTNESHSRKWAFGDIRRSLALGIGKYSAADGSKTTPQTSTKRIGVSRANWMLIQQLMQRQDFLKVVLDRSNNLPLAASTKPTTLTISSKAALSASASRLNNLKSSFDWVQAHGVPINIKGFNLYLEGLISHQDFVTVKTSVDHVILQSRHEEQELDTASRSVLSLKPDIQTLLLLNGNKGLLQGGQQFVEEVSSRGGPELVQQWSDFQRSSARKRRALVQASRSIGGSVPEQITFTKATK
ncbi:hypothetical protein EDD11_004826 [Mortierella claussenii]|nr:hypothetical protein EDD11_004826 [Mortierella claussenii]